MTTLFGYNWEILSQDPNLDTFEKILWNRGINIEDLDNEELLSPWLFPDMEKAVDRIREAVQKDERIMVFGDYDADGITGTVILYKALQELGAEVSCRLPHREKDGYGLHMDFIGEFIDLDIKLIITVDCGISSKKEIAKAKKAGIDVVVTDHHSIPEEAPKPYAIIHPENYTFKHLSGSGVAYKVAEALLGKKAHKFLDLAAIGTIADIVPLYGENRKIARLGLRKISETKWTGLKALKSVSQIRESDLHNMESETVGFKLAPRINAAGRLSDPYVALKLMISDRKTAESLAQELDWLNKERQDLVSDVIENLKYDNKEGIIVVVGDWPQGVSGLVAGRITEETNKPSLALTKNGDKLVGSARSPEYFNITDALHEAADFLEEYGGHAQAAGCTLKVKNLEAFKEKLNSLPIEPTPRTLKIDCTISEEELGMDLYKSIARLKPFGEKNEKPVLLLENFKIKKAEMVGKDRNHLKIIGEFGGKAVPAIKFGAENIDLKMLEDKEISLAASFNRDDYASQGFGLMIEDIKL